MDAPASSSLIYSIEQLFVVATHRNPLRTSLSRSLLLLSQSDLSGSRLSDGRLGCSCKKCHADRNPLLVGEEDPSEGTCWKDILAEYECDICFEVLVGVHVLGEMR